MNVRLHHHHLLKLNVQFCLRWEALFCVCLYMYVLEMRISKQIFNNNSLDGWMKKKEYKEWDLQHLIQIFLKFKQFYFFQHLYTDIKNKFLLVCSVITQVHNEFSFSSIYQICTEFFVKNNSIEGTQYGFPGLLLEFFVWNGWICRKRTEIEDNFMLSWCLNKY